MYEFIQHLINGLAAGTIYALVALGYTMVYGVLQFINFAHSEIFMTGSVIGFEVMRRLDDSGTLAAWNPDFLVVTIVGAAMLLSGTLAVVI